MTLQQLRYVVEVSRNGSISRAAQNLFVTQPSLSKAISDLETEMGITIFQRTNRGVTLTEEGTRFLSYARQVTEQVGILEQTYKYGTPARRVFAVSSQHYAFVVNAFVELVKEYGREKYEFTLRESRTYDIIEDVRLGRSELGVLYLSHYNRDVIQRLIRNADLEFHSIFVAQPHVFVSRDNPLSERESVTLADLKPYPRLSFEQGINNAFYFSEEIYSTEESPKSINVTDRATLFNLLIGLNGYTISSGVLSVDLNGDSIVSIPLSCDEEMEIGYIVESGRPMGELAKSYVEHLNRYIWENKG
ncbi:MAG: LysR family transcriptional regulator [Acutalibacteraceae bacterium]|nr:LysR family transcriptional regulator [Acutalibacteraceae bacterium]